MNLTIDQAAALIEGKIVCRGKSESFSAVAALDDACPENISFLGNEKYYQDYLGTSAGLVIIPSDRISEYPDGVTLIEVENPSFAFGKVVNYFAESQRSFQPGVHPSAWVADDVELDPDRVCIKAGAVIEAGVRIGPGTMIGPGVVVCERASIGEDCILYANSTVREACILGDRVILQPGCVIGADGYGYEFVQGKHEKVDQVGIVELGDDVEIGANTTVDRARFGKTSVGKGTKIDNLVQIAHNVKIGEHSLVVAQSGLAGSSEIGNYVTLAAQAGCVGHVQVKDKAILTARTVATKDLDGDATYMGMPARPMREEMKKMALIARLPKLIEEVKQLKRQQED